MSFFWILCFVAQWHQHSIPPLAFLSTVTLEKFSQAVSQKGRFWENRLVGIIQEVYLGGGGLILGPQTSGVMGMD